MGSRDFPFKQIDLHEYVQSCFDNVERGIEEMHAYQIDKAVPFLIEHPFSALFVDLGLGKSVISLTVILKLILSEEIDKWLVVGPKRVVNATWPTEIGLWRHTAPLTFAHIRDEEIAESVNTAGRRETATLKLEGVDPKSVEGKQRINMARHVASKKAVREHYRKNPACIHLVSRDHVAWLIDSWGKDFPWRGVIWDESDSIKDHTTERFKALKRVRPLLKRFHQLTATPCAETYEHLFAQIYLLDEGERFGRHITKFRERYFNYNRWTHTYKLREGAEEEIAEKIADITLTMKAEDYLKMEKPVTITNQITLPPDQLALYRQMEEEFVVELDSGVEVEAETAAALSQKLLQMTSGVLYETVFDEIGDGDFKKRRVVHELHDHKIDALRNIVEEAVGEPLLVAYWHKSSLERLKKAFPKAVVMDEEGKCIPKWNKKQIPMLLVHPASAAHGLNLQYGGRRIVLFDIPWSLTLYLQLIGRLARQGQTQVVFVHHLVCTGTIDEEVVKVLMEKRDAQELLFTLLKRIRKRLMQIKNQEKPQVCCGNGHKKVEYDEEL